MSESDWAYRGIINADRHYYRATFVFADSRDMGRDVGIVVRGTQGPELGIAMTKQEFSKMLKAFEDAKLV